ncbi:MAG: hypothetical protein Q4G16_03760 [Cruoricaptor ignavus]|nr:hypothetical protein [Cruoricaptor ignavus]
MKKLVLSLAVAMLIASCSGDGKKKPMGADYSIVKTELNLDADKAKQFDEVIDKYKKIREENRKSMGEKPDRVAMFTKMEEMQKQQDAEIANILDADQMVKYNEFVAQNTRKRPRYNDELLAKIQTEAELNEEQMQVVNAANNAFEKAYQDAHDVYHGNGDLAKEYWEKFDAQRKSAIEQAVSPEQYQKFLEVVKDTKYVPRGKQKK